MGGQRLLPFNSRIYIFIILFQGRSDHVGWQGRRALAVGREHVYCHSAGRVGQGRLGSQSVEQVDSFVDSGIFHHLDRLHSSLLICSSEHRQGLVD